MFKLMEFPITMPNDHAGVRQLQEDFKAGKPFMLRISMPKGAEVLRVGIRVESGEAMAVDPHTKGMQRVQTMVEVACLWVEANDEIPSIQRAFAIIPSNGEIPKFPADEQYHFEVTGSYIGTFLLGGGRMAFHAFCQSLPIQRYPDPTE